MTEQKIWDRCPGVLCNAHQECKSGKMGIPCLAGVAMINRPLREPSECYSDDAHLRLSDELARDMPFVMPRVSLGALILFWLIAQGLAFDMWRQKWDWLVVAFWFSYFALIVCAFGFVGLTIYRYGWY